MTLYLKYRPQKISDLDLVEVRETLEKMIKGGSIPHALLFAGPKGTGKTSAARIIAKVLNCEKNAQKLGEPCNKCEQCTSIMAGNNVDVIEIDAASHRGIDDIRALRESIKLSPARARSKVYIIDEAHMLTLEASNALLKTLEEPPSHVYFILATTDPEKLIPTIRSRTTIVNFKKASEKELVDSLAKKAKSENLKFEKEALKKITSFSDGSFRDAVKILEQLVNEDVELTQEKVSDYLDKLAYFDLNRFIEDMVKRDLDSLLFAIKRASQEGLDIDTLIDKVIIELRERLLYSLRDDSRDSLFKESEVIHLIELLIEAKRQLSFTADFENLPLELAVIKWCLESENGESQNKKQKDKENETLPSKIDSNEGRNDKVEADNLDPNEDKKSKNGDKLEKNDDSWEENISDEIWKKILVQVGQINTSMEALLRAVKPLGINGQTFNLGVFYKFHKERLEEARYREMLENVAGRVLNRPVKIVCSLTPPSFSNKTKNNEDVGQEVNNDLVDVAKSIFGS
ncbi:MAG: DNA polymerase III, subunit gamma and tau [Patescibacteria group bacterium]|nr:MAG: DNA polymerase III, subunit gamma and tau [Patescibacteria group bacterium]